MESKNLDTKYQRLATEYSKLRAQAGVLKKAVIEEQSKNSILRETLRQKESALRRAEQEVDSINFRNKQLEHRVASLQDDIEKECKNRLQKNSKFSKLQQTITKQSNNSNITATNFNYTQRTDAKVSNDAIIVGELQKKILENAQLTSLVDDKCREIKLCNDRIKELEKQIEKYNLDVIENERRLRKEIDALTIRNSELETKLVEVTSIMGSEDALSASGSENTPFHLNSSSSNEEKIAFLEKELFHWRTQYEILRIGNVQQFDRNKEILQNGPTNLLSTCDHRLRNENYKDQLPKEQILYNHYNKKFEELLKSKYVAESKLVSYLAECEHLQNCTNFITQTLSDREKELQNSSKIIQTLEEDLASTRINYEEQISVLTEQVISLSDQLASSK